VHLAAAMVALYNLIVLQRRLGIATTVLVVQGITASSSLTGAPMARIAIHQTLVLCYNMCRTAMTAIDCNHDLACKRLVNVSAASMWNIRLFWLVFAFSQ
jgi:hypothetical protein